MTNSAAWWKKAGEVEADDREAARTAPRAAGRWGWAPQDRKHGLQVPETRTPVPFLSGFPTHPRACKDLGHSGRAQGCRKNT